MSVIDRRKNPHALTYQAPADKARAAARPYWENPWRLINDKPEEIRAQIGDLYPEEDIGELFIVLNVIREFYRRWAAGEPYSVVPDINAPNGSFSFWQTAGAIEAITMSSQLWKDADKVLKAKRLDLTGALWWPLWNLQAPMYAGAAGPQFLKPLKVYVCEYCGKIGRAERTDRRYCDNVCRARASRSRKEKAEC